MHPFACFQNIQFTFVISSKNDYLPDGLNDHSDTCDEHKPQVEEINVVVSQPNTSIQPRTMMIIVLNTVSTIIAMPG